MIRLLLLAGTTEGRQLASALAGMEGVETVASLAGATRQPSALDVPTRIGGFGGRAGFESYLRDQDIDAVLDSTHPFAAVMSHRTAEVCKELDLPYAQVLRPEWQPEAGDDWHALADESAAAEVIAQGATVFLATGRQTLERFAGLANRTIYARQIDAAPDPFPFPNGRWIVGRPPFSVSDEMALFAMLNIDWLIVKNAGGDASRSKLDAARALGLRVGMIARPRQPDALRLESVAEALDWVRGLA